MREMKDSGVRWLGGIPSSWKMERVKHGFTRKKEEAHIENPVVLSLARAGVRERDISNNEGQIAESYYNYNPVDIDDLLINPMDLYSGANCSISKIKGVISQAYVNLRYKEGFDPKYYDYYFKIQYWLMAFFSYGKGVSFDNRWTLNAETLMNYPLIVPSYEEQKRIAGYLDHKCTAIDNIIAKQEQIIEKYKEYKLSLITEAVTKGLDSNAEMKYSGLEWIGNIPKHWNLIKGHRIISFTQNGLTRRDLEKSEGQIVLKLKNITEDGTINYEEINRIVLTKEEKENYILKNGDLLFVRVNGSKNLVGKSAIFEGNEEVVAYNDHIIRVRLNDYCNADFLRFYLYSIPGKQEIETHTITSAGQYTISGDGLRDLHIVLPVKSEQEDIVKYLDKKSISINNSIEKKQQIINRLKEYKKSLIFEVVTGKKEV